MTAFNFENIRQANNDLIRAHLHFAILFDDMSNVCPVTLEDPASGDLLVPATAQTSGVIEKKAGVAITHSMDNAEIEGYGDSEPVRTIISKRSVSFDAEYLETNLTVLEKFWGTAFSTENGNLTMSSMGGITLTAPDLPDNVFYRAYLVTQDDLNGNDIFAYYILPQVKLIKVENQTSKDNDAVSYKMTFQAFKNNALGFSVLQGWCGPGFTDLVAAGGFVSEPTSLVITPSAPTVSIATDHIIGEQLVVTGNNGVNYTPLCTFTSGTPANATVNSSGLVIPKTVGTAVITATYLPNGATSPITGTDTVTVTT
jgi:hypothetical protein